MNCWVNTDNNPTQQDRPWDIPKKKGVPARLQEKALAGAGSGDAVLVGDDAPKTTGIPPYPPTPTPKSPLLPLFLPKLIPHRILGEAGEL